MNESQFLRVLEPYYEAFAEHDEGLRLELLRVAMTPDAEIWGPIRMFAGYAQISEKISGFHRNWPSCRMVLDRGLNIFLMRWYDQCALRWETPLAVRARLREKMRANRSALGVAPPSLFPRRGAIRLR